VRLLRTLLLCAALVAVTLLNGSPGAGRAAMSPELAALLASAPAGGDGQAPFDLHVWVMFRDRGRSAEQITGELAAAAAVLPDRTLRRRSRVAEPGASLVDARDLPPAPRYLERVRATGARPEQVSRWLNAVSCRATTRQIAQLARLPEVAYLQPVRQARRAAVPPAPTAPLPLVRPAPKAGADAAVIDYGLGDGAMQQINVPAAHALGLSGAGVVVGLLDTGFRTEHICLDHLPVLGAWDFINGDAIVDNEPDDPATSRNHGTSVLSNVAAWDPGGLVAPAYGVSVLLAKTEDVSQEAPAEEDDWVAGLEWLEAQGADVVSSSLGYIDWYTWDDLDGDIAVTTVAADLAAARGVVVVNSAGNERASGTLVAPADGDSVIAVGAVDLMGAVTWFSSPGPTADGRIKPDVAALGLYNPAADPNDDTAYASYSGTSLACPLVSGVAALVLERVPDLTPMQVREALRETASHPGAPDNDTGWGIVDAHAAATWFGPVYTFTALPDTAATAGPWPLSLGAEARLGVDPATVRVHYRHDGGAWQETVLTASGAPGQWQGEIPAQPAGAVDYWFAAADAGGHATVWPVGAPAAAFSFTVPQDTSTVGDGTPRPQVSGLRNQPNPFNPGTDIAFRLEGDGRVRLSIFDARGMLVRVLHDGVLGAGDHSISWDGRDDGGRAAAGGLYLYRVSSGGEVRQGKMTLVR
jgi:hypothetical protein